MSFSAQALLNYRTARSVIFSELCKVVKDAFPGKDIEVFQGGSWAQGTYLSDSDMDLILFLKGVDPDECLGQDYYKNTVFDPLINYLQSNPDLKRRCNVQLTSPIWIVVPYTSITGEHKMSVDFACAPYFPDLNSFLSYCKSIDPSLRKNFDRLKFATIKSIQGFFEQQPDEVINYIRQVKVWRKQAWLLDSDRGIPKCYLLSMLVIRAYEIAQPKSPKKVQEELVKIIENHETMDIYWEQFFTLADFPSVPVPPRILSPCQPYKNLYEAFLDGKDDGYPDWEGVRERIHSLELHEAS